MADTANLQVLIDLNNAVPDMEPEALEDLTSNLTEEIRQLTDNVGLVRESEVPEHGKPGLAGFALGVLKAEVSVKNVKELLSFLGDRFSGKTLKIEFKANEREYKLEYHSKEQLEDAILAIKQLSKLT